MDLTVASARSPVICLSTSSLIYRLYLTGCSLKFLCLLHVKAA